MILKVIREIQQLKTTKDPKKHMKKLEKLKSKADKSDVLIDGSINKLVRANLITNEMATSLMNDSASITRMVRDLVNIVELLYTQHDMILEDEPTQEQDLEEEGILSVEDNWASLIDQIFMRLTIWSKSKFTPTKF